MRWRVATIILWSLLGREYAVRLEEEITKADLMPSKAAGWARWGWKLPVPIRVTLFVVAFTLCGPIVWLSVGRALIEERLEAQ
jgi:hypothetical protein